MAWIGKKKGTNKLDEISKEKCYELPSEFENSSNSTWHTETITVITRDYIYVCLSIYILVCIYAGEIWNTNYK